MSKRKILLVDDRPATRITNGDWLQSEGYEVLQARTGLEARSVLAEVVPDLVLLDLMLPRMDGLELCRRVREWSYVPILMLTAKDTEVDKIVGLEVGADDYIPKPFEPGEVRARLRAHLRRALYWKNPEAAPAEIIQHGPLRLDLPRHEATWDGARLDLTRLEFDLLYCLAAHPGIVFSRERLMDQVWGVDEAIVARGIDVHISRLRSKIEPDPAQPRFILTVHGIGYKFAD